jgi:LDH2 family malate/lactate/ureidoglycolate dehydrogenase
VSTTSERLSVQVLREFCLSLFRKLGFEREYAETVTNALMEAHLRGAPNQGLGRLPIYVKRIELGLINAKPVPRIVRETDSTAVLDGDNGLGHYAAARAMNLAISKAQKTGIGAVGVRNSTHFGVAAFYGLIAVEQGKIGIVMSNSTPLMAAPGGAERLIGNNPISIAVPHRDHAPIVLDMACSNAAYSSIQKAAQQGERIPPGWGTDGNGQETTDPKVVLESGILIPVGGYKGYGLAIMIDILVGVLTGSSFGKGVTHLYQDLTHKQGTGHFLLALDIDRFIDRESFDGRLDDFVGSIKSSRRAPGFEETLIPGEGSDRRKRRNLELGIELPKAIIDQLGQLADKYELKHPA